VFVACLLLCAGCIKEPSPNVPLPPKPQWLLTKVVALKTQAEPEGGPVYYSARVDEYRYNRHHKPCMHIQYDGPDTNNLKVSNTDTLFYDNQLRPIRVSSSQRYIYRTEHRFFYAANERYPDREETYYIDSSEVPGTPGITRLLYRDTMVYMLDEPAHVDSFAFVYNRQGNYIGIYFTPLGVTVEYEAYDNAVNVGRFLNLDHARALNVPGAEPGPLFSKNNWTSNPSESLYRTITYDAQGRVSKSYVQYNFPTRHVNTYYYYTLLQ
jgi:hypothetical protein